MIQVFLLGSERGGGRREGGKVIIRKRSNEAADADTLWRSTEEVDADTLCIDCDQIIDNNSSDRYGID